MGVILLLPLFHKFNKLSFANSLVIDFEPIVKVKWSDNRLKLQQVFIGEGWRKVIFPQRLFYQGRSFNL